MRSDSVWARDGNADEHELRVECLAEGIVTISDDKMVRILSKPEAAKPAFMLIGRANQERAAHPDGTGVGAGSALGA